MPDFIAKIFGGSVLTGVKDLIGTFKLDPAKKAELQAAIEANAQEVKKWEYDLQVRAMDLQAKEADIAGQNNRAETSSEDTYTKRARPTFLYMVELILGWNYMIVPILGKEPINLPEPLFWLFGSVMLGYVGARSWEKVISAKNVNQ